MYTVNWGYTANDDDEVSVSLGEVVGMMEKSVDGSEFCRVSNLL